MLPEDRIRALHMLDATRTALDFVRNRKRSDLDSSTMLRFALVRAIEIIGEAASKMSRPTRESTPDIPWSLIVATRNRLIHAYFDIDRDILWRTATEELPDLATKLELFLGAETKEPGL